jgi:hypothetical protein
MFPILHNHTIATDNIRMCEGITDKQMQKLSKKEKVLLESLLNIYLGGLRQKEAFVFHEGEDTSNVLSFPLMGNQKIISHEMTTASITCLQHMVSQGYDESSNSQREVANSVLDYIVFSAYKSRPICVSRSPAELELLKGGSS